MQGIICTYCSVQFGALRNHLLPHRRKRSRLVASDEEVMTASRPTQSHAGYSRDVFARDQLNAVTRRVKLVSPDYELRQVSGNNLSLEGA